MKRETKTRSEGSKSSPVESNVSIDDHPLFMDRVPSANDFKNNALLSALAALIDEEEQDQDPGPQRRQRRKVRSEPWNSANSPRGGHSSIPLPSSASRTTRRPAGGHADTCCSGVRVPDGIAEKPTADGKDAGDSTVSASQDPVMDCDVEVAGEPACDNEERKPSPSIGELQICMRLFSMK